MSITTLTAVCPCGERLTARWAVGDKEFNKVVVEPCPKCRPGEEIRYLLTVARDWASLWLTVAEPDGEVGVPITRQFVERVGKLLNQPTGGV